MNHLEQTDLTTGTLWKKLLRFACPFLLTNILQTFYGLTDLWFVGRFAAAADLSALTVGSQIISVVTNVVVHFSTGVAMSIGSMYGKKDENGMRKVTGTAIVLYAVVAFFLTVLLYLASGPLLNTLHTPAEAMEQARAYLRICLLSTVFVVGYNVICALYRGVGNSGRPMRFVAAACAINVLLDAVLVGWLHMGAAGAAIATLTAQAGCFALALRHLLRSGLGFRLTRKDIRLESNIARAIALIGIPLAVQSILTNLSFMVILSVINSLGLTASGAMGITERIISILMIPPISFGSAVAVTVVQNKTAGKPERVNGALTAGVLLSAAMCAIPIALCQIIPGQLCAFFSADALVAAQAAEYLRSYSLDCILVCFVFVANGFFTGMGHALFPLLHSLLAAFAIRIPATLLLKRAFAGSLYAIGFAAPLASAVSVLLCIGYRLYLQKELRAIKALQTAEDE